MNNLNLMCWNTDGIMSSTPYLLECLKTFKVHVCGISEHWLREYNLNFLNTIDSDYIAIAKAVPEANPYIYRNSIRGGVAILVHKSITVLNTIETDSSRIVGVEMQLADGNVVSCFSVYMPASSRPIEVFNDQLEMLETLISVYSKRGRVLVLGDMNVKIRGPRYKFTSDRRTELFASFLRRADMVSANVQSLCSGPVHTFYPTTGNSTTIDHILIQNDISDLINFCKVLDDHALNTSEHRPVICSVNVGNLNVYNCLNNRMKLSWKKALLNGSVCRYALLLADFMNSISVPDYDNTNTNEISKYYNDIVIAMKSASSLTIPAVKFRKHIKPYWTSDVKDAHSDMLNKRHVWINEKRPRGSEFHSYMDYKSSKLNFRKTLNAACDSYISRELEEIDKCGDANQELFWTLFNRRRIVGSTAVQHEIDYNGKTYRGTECVADAWAQHFEDIFSDTAVSNFDEQFKTVIDEKIFEINSRSFDDEDTHLDGPVTVSEISELCLKLKNGKAGGIDNITYEHLKYGGRTLHEHLSNLFNLVIKFEFIPREWKQGCIITLYKGGNKQRKDPNSYRGITLLPVVFKLFENVISHRISDILESDDFPCRQQMAYQKSLSSLHTSFNLQECIFYILEYGDNVIVIFLDSAKAFDTVWHNGLLFKLYEIGIRGKCWRLFRKIYEEMESCVLVNGVKSRLFTVKRGIRQGSALSAKLYLVFINGLLKQVESSNRGAMLMDLHVNIPTQADDICLVSTKTSDMNVLLNICETYSMKWRFNFSPAKSVAMYFSPRRCRPSQLPSDFLLFGTRIELAASVKHVGVTLSSDSTCIDRTIQACNLLRALTLSLLRCGVHAAALNPVTSSKLIKTIIFPKALYGCELWILNQTEVLLLERAQRFIAKSIMCFSRRTRTDMCNGLLGWISLESYIDTRKLLFIGNLCRLDERLLPRKILLTRLIMFFTNGVNQIGLIPDIVRVFNKYGLIEHLLNFVENGHFSQKMAWKRIVKDSVLLYEENAWLQRMSNEPDFVRFLKIHNSLKTFDLMKLSIKYPGIKDELHFVLQLIVTLRVMNETELCHKCGQFYTDTAVHISLTCTYTSNLRDELWCFIINNISDIMFSVFLHGLSDWELFHVLVGGHIDYDLLDSELLEFRVKCVQFIYNTAKLYYK